MLTDKRRDMARSVLPSTKRRRAAAGLALVRRRHRRSIHQQLARLSGPLDVAAVLEFDLGVDDKFPNHLIHDEVLDRRSFDKVAPLIRWAVASTGHIRLEDRLSHVAAALPANVIGAHAVSHLAHHEELAVDKPHSWVYPVHHRHPLDDGAALSELLRRVLEDGHHGALNRLLKAAAEPMRPLLGLHDIESFVEETLTGPEVWKRASRSHVPRDLLFVLRRLESLRYENLGVEGC
ncbi:MAG TPA: hypothetical protein VGS21_06805 [Acidimicrobiales bacterium]|nr:hypothetical protein [Acidimicrobiales bacterium]